MIVLCIIKLSVPWNCLYSLYVSSKWNWIFRARSCVLPSVLMSIIFPGADEPAINLTPDTIHTLFSCLKHNPKCYTFYMFFNPHYMCEQNGIDYKMIFDT